MTRPPLLVLALAAAFLLLVASLVIGSLTTPEFPAYPLSPPRSAAQLASAATADSLVGPATYTLDASGGDAWRRFHFGRNAVVESGQWDIAFRRNKVIAGPGAGVVDLGPVPFDSVAEVPVSGYVPDSVGKWYEYSMLSHLLTSKRHVYAVRTADGRFAKVEILAYYCRDAGAACYTFRYAFQGDGSRRVEKSNAPPDRSSRGREDAERTDRVTT